MAPHAGVANSKNYERAYLAWKGRLPKGLPRNRKYVSPGSCLYDQVVNKVPPCAPKDFAFVDRHVRETSLRSMGGCTAEGCEDGLDGPEEGAESAPAAVATHSTVQHVKSGVCTVRRRVRRCPGSRTITLRS